MILTDEKISPSAEAGILPLVYWPDPILTQSCKDVVNFCDDLELFIDKMIVTMEYRLGIGLAAPQVGTPLNIIIIKPNPETSASITLINPKIVDKSESMSYTMDEGCLSVPGYYEERSRPKTVVVEYYDYLGNKIENEFKDLAAFVVQHEIDHLNGKMFIDTLSKLKKQRLLNKVNKFKKRGR